MDTQTQTADRRVIRTKKAIKNAFARLLTEKDLNSITISEIAAEADINRKTFYNYYSGIFEVIDEIENDIIKRVDNALTDIDFQNSLDSPYLIFEKLTGAINTEMELFSYLLEMKSNIGLAGKIVDLLKAKMKAVNRPLLDIEEFRLELMLEFMISGMVAVYKRWYHSDRSEPIENISVRMNVLMFKGLNGYLNINK